jgi:Lrp/AsnC family transcriptional regulator for asnA, asnC and gidA
MATGRPARESTVDLDPLDRQILDALQSDGRASNSAIAAQLGLTEGAVRQRIKKLLDAGIFRFGALVNPEVLAQHQLCVVGIKVDETKLLEQRARAVSKLPEVRSVAIVTGRYDLLAEVLVDSNQGLIQFLSGSLTKVPGIASSETFLLLKTYGKWI